MKPVLLLAIVLLAWLALPVPAYADIAVSHTREVSIAGRMVGLVRRC